MLEDDEAGTSVLLDGLFGKTRVEIHPRVQHHRSGTSKTNRVASYNAKVVQNRCCRHKQLGLREGMMLGLALLYEPAPDEKDIFVRVKPPI